MTNGQSTDDTDQLGLTEEDRKKLAELADSDARTFNPNTGNVSRPSERIEKTCEHCEDVFEVPPSHSDRRFCSSSCSHSEGHGGRRSLKTDGGRNSRSVEPGNEQSEGGGR